MKVKLNLKTSTAPTKQQEELSAERKEYLAFRAGAESKAAAAKEALATTRCTSWPQFEEITGITVPAKWTKQPYEFASYLAFLHEYVSTAELRFQQLKRVKAAARDEKPPEDEPKYVPSKHTIALDTYKLRPQQRKAVDATIEQLYEIGQVNAVLTPLATGTGKSIIAGAVIKYLQDQNYFGRQGFFPFGRVFFLTRKPVVIKIERTLKKMGIKSIGKDVRVLSQEAFRTKRWAHLFQDYEDWIMGNKVTRKKWVLDPPDLVVVDECQHYKKEKSKKSDYLNGLLNNPITKSLWTSATPGVTINDMMAFSLAAKPMYLDERLTRHNWSGFARQFTSYPDEANGEAMKRYRHEMGGAIIEPPNDPRKVKAYNDVIFLNFRNEASKLQYQRAETAYIEAMDRIGKGIDELGLAMAQFQIFCAEEERIKVADWVDLMLKSHAEGNAPIAAVRYQETLKDIVYGLVQRGVPRDKISIVWGGAKEIKPHEIFTPQEFFDFLQLRHKVIKGELKKEDIPNKLWTKYRKTTTYNKDMVRRAETSEQKALRMQQMSALKLHAQSDLERQDNVDNFQNGVTEFCIYTFSAGGTGIDLDHQFEGVRPREVFSTICYWAEEFVQALGRAYRVATLSNVKQHILFYRNTLPANHVAPKLYKKIASIAKIATSTDDLVSLMEKAAFEQGTAPPEDVNYGVVEQGDVVDEMDLDDDDDDDKNGDDDKD